MVKFALVIIGLILIAITLFTNLFSSEINLGSNFLSLRTIVVIIGIVLLLWGLFKKR